MVRLVIVGGGKMGEALLGGLLDAGWATAGEVAVVEKLEARRDELAARFPGVHVADAPVAADGAVVAVKPDDVAGACHQLGALGVRRVLSIAAGITLERLEAELPAGTPVVRAMPNTPALVGAGASAIAGGSAATADDLAWATRILDAVGMVVQVSEKQLDAVTGLSGSGPGYVFLVAESMIEAGVLVGLPRDISTRLAVQTLLGAAQLLHDTGSPAAELKAGVTSPGGTTAAGLRRLEEGGVRAAFLAAVEAATARSRELGAS